MSTPEWTEVRVLVPAEWAELAADAVAHATGGTVAFGRPSRAAEPVPEGWELVRGFVDARRDAQAVRRVLEAELARLASTTEDARFAEADVQLKPLPHEDWASSWRKQWKPFRVGRLAVVTHDWGGTLREGDVPLRLEPAGAFGTGRHPTTRHCLRFLCDLDLAGKRVLDAGTGSGILAVAACLLGAEAAFGFDVDERSVVDGPELARRNDVGDRARFAHGGFEQVLGVQAAYDVALANIYADVLAVGADPILEALVPGGRFAFSGIHERHIGPAVGHCGTVGFEIEDVWRRGRWRTILGRR